MKKIALLCLLWPFRPVSGQTLPASNGGTPVLHQAERMLGRNKRVLMIGAHPDDEDTELLTLLVRSEGAEAAYLSLSRGEGGQNLIGPELFEGLGLIRTEELLAARSLDGARQYFGREFDFGFSKTLEETARFWPRDSVLKDVVRIIRRFRPQIIVAVFSGTPRDGHGQHQISGWAAQEAFRIAGDPRRFPELASQEHLAPWQPQKLLRSTRFDPGATTISLDGGKLDPDIGQSYRQIAMRGRSLHRSQDMGVLQEPGPSAARLMVVDDRRTGGPADQRIVGADALWAGIDTTVSGLDPNGIEAADQHRHAATAATVRQGLVFDAWTGDGRLVPGQRVMVKLIAWNAGAAPAQVTMALDAPLGWTVGACPSPTVTVAAGTMSACDVAVTVSPNAEYTTPYFLRVDRGSSALYVFSGSPAAWGEPFEPPLLTARFSFSASGASGTQVLARAVEHRYRDQAIGEIREPVFVVPRVDVKLDPPARVWATDWATPREFTVTLQHGSAEPTTGSLALELPAGWPSVPPQSFSLAREEEREVLHFQVRAPRGLAPGRYQLRAVAIDGENHRYQSGLDQVDYPHINPRVWEKPARSILEVAPIVLPAVQRVGYIRGASDRVPEALEEIGLPVELLDATALGRADLSRYDVIVVGSRAYEIDPALVENNARLLAYANAGGRVVVQYQQQPFYAGHFAPAPLTLGQPHDRVTDENAPVTILAPANPVFNRPNRIGPADWSGWVQERGLYFARTWDTSYTPLLEMSDPGEAPLKGSLLIRSVGKGTWIYTGLSFFRQLPAGVPGAFRLFLNLLTP